MPNLFKAHPRGGLPLADRYLEAHRLREEGVPRAEVARKFGVSPSLISSWCERVEEVLADQRNMQKAAGSQ